MSNWRPLSRRDRSDPVFDELQDGVPDYLLDPIQAWVNRLLWNTNGHAREGRIQDIQLRLHRRLNWDSGARSAARSVLAQMATDREFALDVVDLLLHMGAGQPSTLNEILNAGGSAWGAEDPEKNGNWRLMRRSLGPISEAIHSTQPSSARAHQHLIEAWTKLGQRAPDPSGAYHEAVRAVEAVAKPVVLPNDPSATLGKIIRAIEDKPSKWTFALGDPRQVADICNLLWTSQLDRHGTDDESVPLKVSLGQADAAVHLSITLVRFFSTDIFQGA